MQKGNFTLVLTSLLFLGMAISGCKKESTLGIDNNQVIKVPYSLFAGDSSGAVVSTNDGVVYSKVFPSDGYAPHLLLISGDNLLMLKKNLHLSTNSGRDFNPVDTNVRHFPWQTMAYNYPAFGEIYITSDLGRGVELSKDNGLTWEVDTSWAADSLLPSNFEISSFSGLADGKLFAFSNVGNVLFVKDGQGGKWTPVTFGAGFPIMPSKYYLVSNNNTLFLVDHKGIGGAWYSTDDGQTWTAYGQGTLPSNVQYNCAIPSSSSGNSLIIGTDTMGIYLASNGTFSEASGGLLTGVSVYSFASKSNYFKNNAVKNYIYAGTSDGLYRSENNGKTWYSVTTGVWRRIYVALY